MAFSAIRIGGYETVKQKYTEMTGANTTFSILGVRIAAGITTGTLAILAAQPTDVCIPTYISPRQYYLISTSFTNCNI